MFYNIRSKHIDLKEFITTVFFFGSFPVLKYLPVSRNVRTGLLGGTHNKKITVCKILNFFVRCLNLFGLT